MPERGAMKSATLSSASERKRKERENRRAAGFVEFRAWILPEERKSLEVLLAGIEAKRPKPEKS